MPWRCQICMCSLLQRRSALKFGQNRCPRVQKKAPRLTCVVQKRVRLSLLIWAIEKNANTGFGYNNLMQVFFFNRCAICLIIWHTTYLFPLLLFFVVVYRRIQNTLSRTRLLNPPTLRHLHKFLVHHYQLRMWMAEIAMNIYIAA